MAGVCTNEGRKAKAAYIATPISKVARLVVQTARDRIMRMSINGCVARDSTTTHATASSTAVTSSPSTRADVQPHAGPWLTGSTWQS